MALTDGWTAAEKRAGVKRSNEPGLGGHGANRPSNPGYVFKGTPSQPQNNAQQEAYNAYATQVAQQQAAEAAANARKADYINRQFGAQRAQYSAQLRTLNPQQDAAEANVINQYTTKSNNLKQDFAKGQRNLGISRNQITGERERGLDSIRRQLQQQSQSYQNQLGAYGAGDSSASGLVNQALTGSAAKNRGGLLNNTSQQLTAVEVKETDLEDSFQRSTSELAGWKQSTLKDIAGKFLAQKQKIRQAMATADAERAQQLAAMDESLTQDALGKLNQLESLYNRQADELVRHYRSALAPSTAKIDPSLQEYAVKPIDAGQLQGLSMPDSVQVEDPAAVALRLREEEELANGSLL